MDPDVKFVVTTYVVVFGLPVVALIILVLAGIGIASLLN